MKIEWRKSSHSGGVTDEACVEVAALSESVIAIRDSKYPEGPRLVLSRKRFTAMLYRLERRHPGR